MDVCMYAHYIYMNDTMYLCIHAVCMNVALVIALQYIQYMC